MFHVNLRALSTRHALTCDIVGSHLQCRLRVQARAAQHEFCDETVQRRLQRLLLMGTVDNVAVSLLVAFYLSAQRVTDVLCGICGRAGQCFGNVAHIRNGRFYSVSASLHLGNHTRHFVAVKRVFLVAANVYDL